MATKTPTTSPRRRTRGPGKPQSARTRRAPVLQRGSANVFADLGFPPEEAANLKLRADLMIQLSRLIQERGLTQAAAAKLFAVTQPRVSDLVRGKIDRFSIDTLVAMLGHAGAEVELVVQRRSGVA